MASYYNENDPFAAAWLRELIQADLIAPGDVDERSIADVRAADLATYRQCHFFAGIGGWSYALRLAGWDDERPVWTGSCPCQPFSSAGRAHGADDPRHLWPTWVQLIVECRPDVVFGEQVASPDGLAWLDLVHADLEGAGYAVGAVDLCAASVGAPHIRQRLWFVAQSHERRRRAYWERKRGRASTEDRAVANDHRPTPQDPSALGALGLPKSEPGRLPIQPGRSQQRLAESVGTGEAYVLGDASETRCHRSADAGAVIRTPTTSDPEGQQSARGIEPQRNGDASFWADAEWIACRDSKSRPAQSGIFPLAPRLPGRVGLLRGAGNSIVPQVAAEVIGAYMEISPHDPTLHARDAKG